MRREKHELAKKTILIFLIVGLSLFSIAALTISEINAYRDRVRVRTAARLKPPSVVMAKAPAPPQRARTISREDLSKLSEHEKNYRLQSLFTNSREPDIQQVKALVDAGANINMLTLGDGQNLLMLYLDVNFRSFRDVEPNPGIVDRLVGLGLDIDARDSNGWTALYYALGNAGMFDAIATRSAPLDAERDGELMEIALEMQCEPSQIRCLLKLGADPNARDPHGRTPLSLALWSREITELLLASGADAGAKDYYGQSVLTLALSIGQSDRPIDDGAVKCLLDWGMDPNMRDGDGRMLLMYALQDMKVLQVLLDHGADINAVTHARYFDKDFRLTPHSGFAVTAVSPNEHKLDGVNKQKDGRIPNRSLDLPDGTGRGGGESLLWQFLSSGRGQRDMLSFLIERGANVNLADVQGHTPLMCAAQTPEHFDGAPTAVEILLRAGADANAKDDAGMTAFLCAAAAQSSIRQKERIFRKLLEAGADPLVRTPSGETPLLLFARTLSASSLQSLSSEAEERAAAECVKLLLATGIGVEDADGSGKTALHEAILAGAPLPVVRKLLNAGASPSFPGGPASLCSLLEARREFVVFDLDGLFLFLQSMPSLSSGEHGPSLLAWVQQGGFNAYCRTLPASEVGMTKSATFPVSILAELLKHDWSQRERNEALIAAARYGHKDALQLLIEDGVDINATNGAGETVFTAALGPSGPREEIWGLDSPLPYRVQMNRYRLSDEEKVEWIRHCLKLGHNANTTTQNGGTVLTKESLHEMSPALIDILLDHGADVHRKDASGRTCLHMQRPGSVVGMLLASGVDGGALDSEGRSPLHFATPRDIDGLALLISADRMEVNRQDASGRTPLLNWVQREGGIGGVRLLLDAGADPAIADASGHTALHFVPPYDMPTLTSLIASGRTNINAQDANGRTALFSWLERREHPDGVRLLLDAGADATTRSGDGRSAFSFLLAYSSFDDRVFDSIVEKSGSTPLSYVPYFEEFLRQGADPNEILSGGKAPIVFLLHQPTTRRSGRWAIFDFSAAFEAALFTLTEYGADFDLRDTQGFTVWDYAREERGKARLELLRQAARHARPPGKNPTLSMRVAATCASAAQIVPALDEKGEIDATDSAGWTVLAYAAWSNSNPEVVRYLLSRGADPNHRDIHGRTPLMRATQAGNNVKVVGALLEGGACVNLRDLTGNDALSIAIQRDADTEVILELYLAALKLPDAEHIRGQVLRAVCATTDKPHLVRELLKRGAPIDEPDAAGQTPLMHAVSRNGNPDVVRVLLREQDDEGRPVRPADANARDAAGLSVLDYAWKGNVQIYKMLLEAGADPRGESTWWSEAERSLMRDNPYQDSWNTTRRVR